MLCFHTPKTAESQTFSDIFNGFRKETLTWNCLRLQVNIVVTQI